MKPKEYKVEKLDRSIHMEPKTRSTEELAATDSKPVKICKKAEAYEWPNGKIDIMFKDDAKQKAPTMTKIAGFPFATLMQSAHRFNIVLSCSKEEIKLLEHEMIMNREYWMQAMYAAIEAQRNGETAEQLAERINEIKQEGDFVV